MKVKKLAKVRVVFFGMTGQFSLAPLEQLLAAGAEVAAVIVPAGRGVSTPRQLKPYVATAAELPLVDPYLERNIVHLAWQHNVPVWEVGSLSAPQTWQFLADLQPDLITVACFPRIFPPALLDLPRCGCLNLHPSLLPAYRGPEPLFWIAYHDERVTGVTLHFLSQGVDSGDIIAQTQFERPDGLSGTQLERRCAEEGSLLLAAAVRQLAQDELLARCPQVEAEASYFPQPTAADVVIPTTWPARRAFNFARGAGGWPLAIDLEGTRYRIRVVKSYSTEHTLDQSHIFLGDELWVQMQPGVLWVKI